MHFKDQIHQVTEWHSKILKYSYNPDFMEFLNEYVANYFEHLSNLNTGYFQLNTKNLNLKLRY